MHPEAAEDPVGEDRQLGPGAVTIEQGRQRDRLAGLARTGHGVERVKGLLACSWTKIRTVPPHIRPTPVASSSEMPYVMTLGSSPARIRCASSTSAPSTHPPVTEPSMFPRSSTSICAPGSSGAEPIRSTSIAFTTAASLAQPGRGDGLGSRQRAQAVETTSANDHRSGSTSGST